MIVITLAPVNASATRTRRPMYSMMENPTAIASVKSLSLDMNR
jgi:hypothetical protein